MLTKIKISLLNKTYGKNLRQIKLVKYIWTVLIILSRIMKNVFQYKRDDEVVTLY